MEQRTGYRQSGENRLYDRPSAKGGHTLYHLLVLPLHHQVLLNTQGARTDTLMCTVYCVPCTQYSCGSVGASGGGGESRPWLFPASMLHLILHSAIRTFIPPSPATGFAFCSEAIQPSPLPCPACLPVQCPGAQVAQPPRFTAQPPPTYMGGTTVYSTALVHRRFCLAVVVQWACWTDCKHVSHLHGTQTCPLMPSVW